MIVCGDIDGDGKVDVVTANTDENTQLFYGKGDGNFDISDTTLDSAIDTRGDTITSGGPATSGDPGKFETVALFDYDGDGDLDVYFGAFLMKNNGDRTFTDLGTQGPAFAASKCVYDGQMMRWDCTSPIAFSVADYDADGDLDLFINMAQNRNNELWRNEGGGVFDLQVTAATALAVHSVGSAWEIGRAHV